MSNRSTLEIIIFGSLLRSVKLWIHLSGRENRRAGLHESKARDLSYAEEEI